MVVKIRVKAILCSYWANGGDGTLELAEGGKNYDQGIHQNLSLCMRTIYR